MAESDLAALVEAVAAAPDDATLRCELALAYSAAGQMDEAIAAFVAAHELDPDDIEPLLGAASLAHRLGRTAEAEQYLHQAVEVAPDSAQVYRLIYETSAGPDQLVDRLVGAARYLELAGEVDDRELVAGELERLLSAAAEQHGGALSSGEATVLGRASEATAELLLVMPYVARALPAEVWEPLDTRLRRLRVELEASQVSGELPAETVAAARLRRAELPHVEAALEELSELESAGRLPDDLAGLRGPLSDRLKESRAALERIGLNDATAAAFDALAAAAEQLAQGEALGAMHGFQDVLVMLQGLGDDHNGPLAPPAALAYDGLARAVMHAAPDDAEVRVEHLNLAFEAANEALSREPTMVQPYREQLAASVQQARAAAAPPAPATVAPIAEVEAPAAESGPVAPEPESEAVSAEVEVVADEAAPEPVKAPPAAAAPAPDWTAQSAALLRPAAAPTDEDERALALLAEAAELLASGDLDAAAERYQSAAATAKGRRPQALALAGLAQVSLRTGDRGAALEASEQAARLDFGCVEAHLARAAAAELTDEWTKALESYQFAEAAAPDNVEVQRHLGLTLCQMERWHEAAEALTKALAANPADAWLCAKLGEAFRGTGQMDHARACFEEALKQGLESPYAEGVRAWLKREDDRRREAEARAAAKAVVVAPAEATEEDYDPDTSDPDFEVHRPRRTEDTDVRQRVLRKAVADLDFDPDTQVRCRVCKCPNDKGAERCQRCGHALEFVEVRYEAGKRPCFVATATMGSAMAPEVATLRCYRDHVLLARPVGRALVAVYERVGPVLARWIEPRPRCRRLVRRLVVAPAARWAARYLERSEC